MGDPIVLFTGTTALFQILSGLTRINVHYSYKGDNAIISKIDLIVFYITSVDGHKNIYNDPAL